MNEYHYIFLGSSSRRHFLNTCAALEDELPCSCCKAGSKGCVSCIEEFGGPLANFQVEDDEDSFPSASHEDDDGDDGNEIFYGLR